MRCEETRENLVPLLLGSVDRATVSAIDDHLNMCNECTVRLKAKGNLLSEFALSVPQIEPPPRVKQRLFSRVDRETRFRRWIESISRAREALNQVGHGLLTAAGTAGGAALIVIIVVAGVWPGEKVSQLSEQNQKGLSPEQISSVAQGEGKIQEISETQPPIALDSPVTVTRLSSTEAAPDSQGVIYVSAQGKIALLTARGLPVLSSQEIYRVSILKAGQRHYTGDFEVNTSGYGQHYIQLAVPLTEFDAIVISIESIERADADEPVGESILKGDL